MENVLDVLGQEFSCKLEVIASKEDSAGRHIRFLLVEDCAKVLPGVSSLLATLLDLETVPEHFGLFAIPVLGVLRSHHFLAQCFNQRLQNLRFK